MTESFVKSPMKTVEPPKPLHPPPLNGPVNSPKPSGIGPSAFENEAPPLLIPAPLATYSAPTNTLNVYAPQDMPYKPHEDLIPDVPDVPDVPDASAFSPVTTSPALTSIVPSEGRTTPGSTCKHTEPTQDVQKRKPTNTLKGSSPKCNFENDPLPPSTVLAAPDPQPIVKVAEGDPASAEKSTKGTRTANDEHLAHLLAPLLQPPKEEPWIVKRTRKRRKPKSADSKKQVEFESEESRGSSMTSSKPNSPKKLSGPEAEARRALRTARNQRKKARRRKKKRSKEQKETSASPEPTENEPLVEAKEKEAGRQSACAWLQAAVYRLFIPATRVSPTKKD